MIFRNTIPRELLTFIGMISLVLLINNNSLADCGVCGNEHSETEDIVHVAEHAGQFKTLLTAAKAAGLVDTLKSEGPFTLFAPTDKAFGKLPEGTLETLLSDQAKLKEILLYHVVSGKVMAADVIKLKKAPTANKKTLAVSIKGDTVYIDKSKVTVTDLEAGNGIIHVVDTVLIPN